MRLSAPPTRLITCFPFPDFREYSRQKAGLRVRQT